MFTLLFMTMFIVFLIIFSSLISLALKASWGIFKILFSFIALPIVFVGMIMSGFALFLLPGLLVLLLILVFGLVL